MTKPAGEIFSSRWALILAGLGMAVGTGNLWRFPRIAAQNGGAAFLIPWLIFLVVWSLPIMIAEFGIGRAARRGPVGAFTTLLGSRHAWMGGFIAVTTIMIMFYYAARYRVGDEIRSGGGHRTARWSGRRRLLGHVQHIGLAAPPVFMPSRWWPAPRSSHGA